MFHAIPRPRAFSFHVCLAALAERIPVLGVWLLKAHEKGLRQRQNTKTLSTVVYVTFIYIIYCSTH